MQESLTGIREKVKFEKVGQADIAYSAGFEILRPPEWQTVLQANA
jgi:hypothetical protein